MSNIKASLTTWYARYLKGTDWTKFSALFVPTEGFIVAVMSAANFSPRAVTIGGMIGAAIVTVLLLTITKGNAALAENLVQDAVSHQAAIVNTVASLKAAQAVKQDSGGTVVTAAGVAKQAVDLLTDVATEAAKAEDAPTVVVAPSVNGTAPVVVEAGIGVRHVTAAEAMGPEPTVDTSGSENPSDPNQIPSTGSVSALGPAPVVDKHASILAAQVTQLRDGAIAGEPVKVVPASASKAIDAPVKLADPVFVTFSPIVNPILGALTVAESKE